MPIKKVSGGYRWGNHGKVYPNRIDAEKQAAAAHASGYTEDESFRGAGIVLIAPDNTVLFTLRSESCDNPNTWCFPGGQQDGNESPQETAIRETCEEAGYISKDPKPFSTYTAKDGKKFYLFKSPVKHKFTPKLSDESTEFIWASLDNPPEPLHYGVKAVLDKIMKKNKTKKQKLASDEKPFDWFGSISNTQLAMDAKPSILALDRASVRSVDQDGRLHVAITNISKANICPYRGSEIPNGDELGLDPDKIYMLYRDPEELKKGAATFNNIPVLDRHIPVHVTEPQQKYVIGSTGTDAVFDEPYLMNSMVIWTSKAIDDINSKKQQEISCAYRYEPDMTSGDVNGEHYDGIMRNIRGNHVAIVTEGRAGPDVVVGDSKTLESKPTMKHSKKAAAVKGALLATMPKLASDSALIDNVLQDVKKSNFKIKKYEIVSAIKPLMANDAELSDLVELLDKLDDSKEPEVAADDDYEKEDDVEVAEDADPIEEILDLIRGKVSDEDLDAVKAKLESCMKPAEDEEDEDDEKEASEVNVAQDEPEDFEGKPENPAAKDDEDKPMGKAAMDAKLKEVRNETIRQMRAIADAEKEVEPYVGKLAIAQDSVEGVYKAALICMSKDIKGVHPSAYRHILMAQAKPSKAAKFAADSNIATDGMSDDFMASLNLDRIHLS